MLVLLELSGLFWQLDRLAVDQAILADKADARQFHRKSLLVNVFQNHVSVQFDCLAKLREIQR